LKFATSIDADRRSIRRIAERFQVPPTTAKRWADRYRIGGPAAMADRVAVGQDTDLHERRIINLRLLRRWGPHSIAFHRLTAHHSTVSDVLRRHKMQLLRHLDQNTGLAVRRQQPRR